MSHPNVNSLGEEKKESSIVSRVVFLFVIAVSVWTLFDFETMANTVPVYGNVIASIFAVIGFFFVSLCVLVLWIVVMNLIYN